MTVQELIDKLGELPEDQRNIPVRVETETEGAELTDVRVSTGGNKIWWQPDSITLSSRW